MFCKASSARDHASALMDSAFMFPALKVVFVFVTLRTRPVPQYRHFLGSCSSIRLDPSEGLIMIIGCFSKSAPQLGQCIVTSFSGFKLLSPRHNDNLDECYRRKSLSQPAHRTEKPLRVRLGLRFHMILRETHHNFRRVFYH